MFTLIIDKRISVKNKNHTKNVLFKNILKKNNHFHWTSQNELQKCAEFCNSKKIEDTCPWEGLG